MMIVERKNTRGKIEILASILFHCKEGIKKTHIMCKANLGYEQISYYLPNLVELGLVTQVIENGYVIYRTTDAGRQYLQSYVDIVKLLSQKRYNQLALDEKNLQFYKAPGDEQNGQITSLLEETEFWLNL